MGRRHIALVALLLVIGGCGDGAAQTTTEQTAAIPDVVPAAGYEAFASDEFSILLPEGWTVVSADDIDMAEILDAAEFDVELAEFRDIVAAAFDSGGKLFAFDFSTGTPDFVTNLNVLALPSPVDTVADLEEMSVAQLDSAGATLFESATYRVPAGSAYWAEYTMPTFGTEVSAVSVLVDGVEWAITVSAMDLDTVDVDVTTMAESLRVTG